MMLSIIKYDILSFCYKLRYDIKKLYLNYIKNKTSYDSVKYFIVLKKMHDNTNNYLCEIEKCKSIIVKAMNKYEKENKYDKIT